jgi:hypothetical protein
MSNEEMVGRIAALEVIAMTALGLHFVNIRNDPDHQRSGVLLTTLRDALRTQAATLPTEAQKHTMCYGNHLLDAVGQFIAA